MLARTNTERVVTEFFFIIGPDKKDCSLPSKEEADAARPEKIRSVRNPQILSSRFYDVF